MNTRHYLVGYDKREPQPVRVEFPILPEQMAAVTRLVSLYEDDPEALEPYLLAPAQAEAIASAIGRQIDGEAYAFALQAYAEQDVFAA